MIMIAMQVLFLPFQVSETTITVGYCHVVFVPLKFSLPQNEYFTFLCKINYPPSKAWFPLLWARKMNSEDESSVQEFEEIDPILELALLYAAA